MATTPVPVSAELWAARRLLGDLASVSDADLLAEMGLFASSIHGTIAHILCATELWLFRLDNAQHPVTAPSQLAALWDDENPFGAKKWQLFYPNRRDLFERAIEAAARLAALARDENAEKIVRYFDTSGAACETTRERVFSHLVLHGYHHRGQITAAMTRMNIPFSGTDLMEFFET
jgi:uncharacterized damage-inducible protein DinB